MPKVVIARASSPKQSLAAEIASSLRSSAMTADLAYVTKIIVNWYQITGDPSQIRASGGFICSPFWLQMTADVLNRELVVPVWGETSSLGVALWAIKGPETLSSLEAIEKLIPMGEVCRPDSPSAEIYERL